jgi:hypothetical protein
MYTNSTQKTYRFTNLCALSSFVGCGMLSMFYFYKEGELAEALTGQAKKIKELEIQCYTAARTVPNQLACQDTVDQHLRFQRNLSARQEYRHNANMFLALSCALPLLTLAVGRWWHWVLTGRFRSRKRQRK